MKPKVSICIPTFNGESYIGEALQSALNQTYKNLEIVVSDDASTDKTLEIIEGLKETTKTPIHIYNHNPNGIGANWNHCIQKANGDYIKYLFQDDVLLPTCIEKMVNLIESNIKFGLVACRRSFIIDDNYKSNELMQWIHRFSDLQINIPFKDYNDYLIIDRKLFKSENFLKPPFNKIGEPTTYLFRKDLIAEVGYFREDLKQVLDYEFCYRVLKKYSIAILKEELIRFRLHESQATNVNKGKRKSDYEIYRKLIAKDYFWYLSLKKKVEILKNKYSFLKFIFLVKHKLGL